MPLMKKRTTSNQQGGGREEKGRLGGGERREKRHRKLLPTYVKKSGCECTDQLAIFCRETGRYAIIKCTEI